MSKLLICFGLVALWNVSIYSLAAQDLPDLNVQGSINGRVIDEDTKEPLEFATVALYSFLADEAVTGVLTDDKGYFSLKGISLGMYSLEVSFVGFQRIVVNQILVLPKQPEIFLGDLKMSMDETQLNEVVVTGEKAPVTFKADRKVLNISADLTVQGGTLVEALENQPSIKTDMDGNMTLRGSANYTVLINGKPTTLKGSDALQQIPANTVENVEIITNPSSRYDSEGEVGIINVITKKDFAEGFSGVANASGGLTSNYLKRYSGDANVQWIRNKVNYTLSISAQHNPIEGEGVRNRKTYGEDTLSLSSDIDMGIYRENYSAKAGAIFTPSSHDTWGLEMSLGKNDFERTIYGETFYLAQNDDAFSSDSRAETSSHFVTTNLNYEKVFDPSIGHKMSINSFFSFAEDEKQDQLFEESFSLENYEVANQSSNEEANDTELRVNFDYTKPINSFGKLELGYQIRQESNKIYQDYSLISDASASYDSNQIKLTRGIHAAYIQLSGEQGSWNYQLGLRPELTIRNIKVDSENEKVNYFKVFPSANFSYGISQTDQLKFGYSMRINRPGTNQLNPYTQYIDLQTQRTGNTYLLPEYVHSFELSYLKRVITSFLSVDLFYRQTKDKISPYWSIEEDDSFLLSYENVGEDYSYGTEILASVQLAKWCRVSGSTSLYRYNINGDVSGEDVSNSSNSWNARLSTNFNIAKTNTSFQLNVLYNSDVASSQGERSGFYATLISVKQQLFDNRLDLSIQIRDAFSTIRFSSLSQTEFFVNEMQFSPYTPIALLSISYRFNNYRKSRNLNRSAVKEMDFQSDFSF